MKNFGIIEKQLCMNSFMTQVSSYGSSHRFDAQQGKENNSFGYIEEGSVDFTTLSGSLSAVKGDFIYIPSGLRYYSMWTGNPEIRFISLHFRCDFPEASFWRSLSLQKIDALSNPGTRERVNEICGLSHGDRSDQLKAYGGFYSLVADALPYMKKDDAVLLPETLRKALNYIEENCASITSVADIAAACYVSESRLYHLFNEQLGTTPVTYLNRNRIIMALEMLKHTDDSLQQIADKLNFHSEYYFRKIFRQITGVLPSEFRKLRKPANKTV